MRFVHFGDTHLGKRQFKLEARERDFEAAFKQVIDFAIARKVDFVIHSGDLFDNARPSTSSLIFAVEQLSRLKAEGIPLFIVPGSHDIGVDETILNLLEKLGLLKNLATKEHYEKVGEKIIVKGERIGKVWICGIAGKRAGIRRIYASLKPELDGDFNIFVFHHAIGDVTPFADIPIGALPVGFDYYAGGHWHSKFIRNYSKGIVVYPGSTEYCDVKEMWNDPSKFFVYYDGKPNFVPIKTRPIRKVELNFEGSGSELMQKILPMLKDGNGEILLLKVKGKIQRKVEIDRKKLVDIARENGFLYMKLIDETIEESKGVTVKHKSVDEIEEEFLRNLGYDEKSIRIAKILINSLSKEADIKQLLKEIEEEYETS